jgi:hypothetical protein
MEMIYMVIGVWGAFAVIALASLAHNWFFD